MSPLKPCAMARRATPVATRPAGKARAAHEPRQVVGQRVPGSLRPSPTRWPWRSRAKPAAPATLPSAVRARHRAGRQGFARCDLERACLQLRRHRRQRRQVRRARRLQHDLRHVGERRRFAARRRRAPDHRAGQIRALHLGALEVGADADGSSAGWRHPSPHRAARCPRGSPASDWRPAARRWRDRPSAAWRRTGRHPAARRAGSWRPAAERRR